MSIDGAPWWSRRYGVAIRSIHFQQHRHVYHDAISADFFLRLWHGSKKPWPRQQYKQENGIDGRRNKSGKRRKRCPTTATAQPATPQGWSWIRISKNNAKRMHSKCRGQGTCKKIVHVQGKWLSFAASTSTSTLCSLWLWALRNLEVGSEIGSEKSKRSPHAATSKKFRCCWIHFERHTRLVWCDVVKRGVGTHVTMCSILL